MSSVVITGELVISTFRVDDVNCTVLSICNIKLWVSQRSVCADASYDVYIPFKKGDPPATPGRVPYISFQAAAPAKESSSGAILTTSPYCSCRLWMTLCDSPPSTVLE